MARLSPVAVLVLIASVICFPTAQAKGSVAGEFKSLARSHEGKLVEAKLKRQFIAGSWRDDLASGLTKYGSQLTAFQKDLIRLSLQIASPQYRRLRAAALEHRGSAKLLPELRDLLSAVLRSSALRLMLRKGEWLKHHPARLRSSLAIYAALERDTASTPLNRELAAVLGRPGTSRFIQDLSPLRVIALLTPRQVDQTPPLGPRGAAASSSSVGGFCKATGAYVVKKVVSTYMWYVNALWAVVEWGALKTVYLYNRYPPSRADIAQLTGDLATHHPSQAPAITAGAAFNWALGAYVTDGMMSTAAGIDQGIVRLQGADTPTKPAERKQFSGRGRSVQAGGSKAMGEACHPSEGKAGEEATGGGVGEGPLHWTGKIEFHNSWTETLPHENGDPPGTSVGTGTATWTVDAYSPQSGTERAPGEYSYYYLPYIGSWEQSIREEDHCGSTPTLETIEGSGSGPPPSTHGFPWQEEVLIEPPWLLNGWWLRLPSTPLGERHWHVESCPPGFDRVETSVPYYSLPGDVLYNRGTPLGCNVDEIPLQWTPFTSPGRIAGQRTGSGPACSQAVLSWDLAVTCPNGDPPVHEGLTLACAGLRSETS